MSTQKSIQDPRSFMAHEEREPSPRKIPYPLDSTSYRILDEIGSGVSAIVYKAECVPINSTLVAIKSIDLDQSRADLDNVRREAKAMSLLSHPNILRAHCSFTVDRRLWVVMPFMSAGSLQSIISSSFPEGFSEPCIATILKETLNALSYLHDQGHLHRDIKAGNILIDSNGSVKLADFGVSASIYESNSSHWSSSSSSMMLTDVAGTPYWMAPEVIHSHTGYSFKADIWSFGITALELSHGRPPLSHLPPSKSLIMKITKRFRFSDYHEKNKREKQKKFSKSFMEMVKSCLDQDPSKRPSAEKLMKHSFFKNNCKNSDFLVKNVLQGLPSVEDRFKESKLKKHGSMSRSSEADEEDDDGEGSSTGERIKHRRISGWNFNEDGFELDPVFPPEREDQTAVKKVRFGGELIIQDKVPESGGHDSSESNLSSPAQVTEETQVSEASEGDETRITEETQVGEASERNETRITEETQVGEEASEGDENRIRVGEASEGDENRITEETQVGEEASEGDENRIRVGEASEVETRSTVDREAMIGGLMFLRQSLDEQRQQVTNLIGLLRGEEGGVMVSREEQLVQMIERMNIELENEKKKNFELEMELEFLKLQICGASRGDDQPSGSGSGSGGVE